MLKFKYIINKYIKFKYIRNVYKIEKVLQLDYYVCISCIHSFTVFVVTFSDCQMALVITKPRCPNSSIYKSVPVGYAKGLFY